MIGECPDQKRNTTLHLPFSHLYGIKRTENVENKSSNLGQLVFSCTPSTVIHEDASSKVHDGRSRFPALSSALKARRFFDHPARAPAGLMARQSIISPKKKQ
jgi:hypothetical protein